MKLKLIAKVEFVNRQTNNGDARDRQADFKGFGNPSRR